MENKTLPQNLNNRVARLIDLIVIHCSATANGVPISTAQKNAAEVINDWHSARGFKRTHITRTSFNPRLQSIGYHYVIDLDGSILTGQSLDEVGAHAKGFNVNSIGICLIGGREQVGKYTPAQWNALAELTEALAKKFNIPLRPPVRHAAKIIQKGICGHRDLSPDLNGDGVITSNEWLKTCPGFSIYSWLSLGLKRQHQHLYTESKL
jgi:Negative regulator of beta-lactamase expression